MRELIFTHQKNGSVLRAFFLRFFGSKGAKTKSGVGLQTNSALHLKTKARLRKKAKNHYNHSDGC